ncbi:MAG: CaiB/BaiF CoA-transferase family protein [Polyangiales bacterium]
MTSMLRDPSRRPLTGVRVLDLTRLLPGPFASLVLADLGAQVDKVEDPGQGDYLRHMPPAAGGVSGAFFALNRDKRSLVLDLKNPEGSALLRRLARAYDVVLEGFRPGVLARLGCSHEALLAENPRLIVCAITGYGQDGPLAQRAGHDINYLARAGVLGVTGPSGGAPAVSGVQMADVAGGAMWAVIGVLSALRQRDLTGVGGVVDIALCEGALPLAAFSLGAIAAGEPSAPRGGSVLDGGVAPYNTYLTRDGEAVSLGALEPKFLMAFAAGTGMDLDADALRPGPHQVALRARFAELFASRTRAEWESFSIEHDCCLEPALRPEELVDDPQHRARGVFFSVRDEGGEARTVYRTPVGAGDAVPHHAARAAGADADAVLRDAGLDEGAIRALRAAGALG